MLEKIGLPAKPSMRGGSWVVDASHCQGCSSQFTFINRKHHCRRCGGLFCNSCTQQRMILRGQGDSAVRICDPCKKLEDAARFELRYGHKNRNVKETEGKQQFSSSKEPQSDMISDLQRAMSSASSSYIVDEGAGPEGKGDVLKEMGSKSPEELRQQAAEEKRKFRVLKGEGKSEEALQAFKRGKELERQAGALEIALRKSRRKASVLNNSVSSQRKNEALEGLTGKKDTASQSSRVVKDDLLSELRELGWSDADLHDADKKPEKQSLEGELSSIIKELPKKSNVGRGSGGIDNSQVLAHKKKALMLKREGKLAEAKEELKKAKLLEKHLEEQELLGQSDDSDDELSSLIRSMDDDKQDNPLADYGHDLHVNFGHLSGLDDLVFDDNFDVTEDDIDDPDIAAALRSFGWSEEDDHTEEDGSHSVLNREALENEVLSLKREALSQKHAGNVAEAMSLLKKAKLLEKDLESTLHRSSSLQKKSMQQKSGRSSMPKIDDESTTETKDPCLRPKPKSKLLIQRELLDLKKKALSLRREGRTDEADEELRKGKDLERQLQEMEDAPKLAYAKADGIKKDRGPASGHQDISADLGFDEEDAAEVTEEDMCDPAMLSVLKNLGWVDEQVESASNTRNSSKQTNDPSTKEARPSTISAKVLRNKAQIQRELLGIKRKALALRRQGKTEEAEDELEKAKSLEKQIAEMEAQHLTEPLEMKTDVSSNLTSEEKSEDVLPADDLEGVIKTSFMKNATSKAEVNAVDIYNMGLKNGCATSMPPSTLSDRFATGILKLESSQAVVVDSQHKPIGVGQSTIYSQSEKGFDQIDFPTGVDRSLPATVLKPTNKESGDPDIPSLEHAIPELLADARGNSKSDQRQSVGMLDVSTVNEKQTEVTTGKQVPNNEANAGQLFDSLNDQILARKRKAVALKREGKLSEAREALRQAKLLEKSLEEGKHVVGEVSQNSSASTSGNSSGVQDSKRQRPMSSRDRLKLQQESLAHKRQALKLRREGKIEESDAELELAKSLEAQLEEIDSQNSNNKKGAMDEALEDLLDPQLLSALKSIGWDESDIVMHSQEKLAPKSSTKNMNINSGEKSEAKSSIPKNADISPEKATLEEQIKAEKLRAVNLKRAGKPAEALEALRAAKRLEKRLISST